MAVTIIEVALIVTLMADGGDKSSTLARDTVFAAVVITCNGIVGLCLLVASLRHATAVFNPEGTGASSHCWCCSRRPSPRCAPRVVTVCRPV
ncbi:Ca2+/H+ antiporter [Streptomyces afghaniensis]|nr:Ca2+/H+ antiporter [Streptomyces afghaniensis]